jgi:hypothetical protein
MKSSGRTLFVFDYRLIQAALGRMTSYDPRLSTKVVSVFSI